MCVCVLVGRGMAGLPVLCANIYVEIVPTTLARPKANAMRRRAGLSHHAHTRPH